MKYTKKNLKRLLTDATGSKWYLLQLIKINDCNANCSACGISERIVSLECGHKVSAANGGKFILSNLSPRVESKLDPRARKIIFTNSFF